MKEEIKNLTAYIPELELSEVQAKYGLTKVVRLSANENPYGTSPKVKEVIKNENFLSNYYPDSYANELRQLIAKYYHLKTDQIVFGVGLDEIIQLISRTFLQKGDQVIVSQPTFSEYALHAQIEGAKVVEVLVDKKGHTDFKAMLAKITPQTKLIWLCNPNNPTGVYEQPTKIESFLKEVPKDTLVLIDEAYIEFVTNQAQNSCLPLLNKYENVAVLRTFSKVYGLANFRIGWVAFDSKLAHYLQTVRLPYNLATISQKVAVAAFLDQDFVSKTVTKNALERDKWLAFFEKQKIFHYESQTNFIFFQVKKAKKLAQYLLVNGYQIREGFKDNWLRLTVGQSKDNEQVQKLMIDFFEKN